MPHLLCVAGLDPSGGAGLSADMRACHATGVNCLPVASAITAQNRSEFLALEPVPSDLLELQIKAAVDEFHPNTVKVGLLGNADNVRAVAKAVAGMAVVVDPVLRTSSGETVADDMMVQFYIDTLFSKATVITPNAFEASELSGIEVTNIETAKEACRVLHALGPKVVVVKGGHLEEKGTDVVFDGVEFQLLKGEARSADPRGTGCTFSTLIAGYLAHGLQPLEAIKGAKADMDHYLQNNQENETDEVWLEVKRAALRITSTFPAEWIAEVGNNIAFARKGAKGPEDVCSLDSRLIKKGNRVVTLGQPVFGRDSHVGRVVLAAMRKLPEIRCAMNIKFSDATLDRARAVGLKAEGFDRRDEPVGGSSMDWGTGRVLEEHGRVDIIFDRGSVGKEPMIRLLATDPDELLRKLEMLTGGGE